MSAVTTTTASELREAFKLFDADDNGEVTVAELNKYAQRNKIANSRHMTIKIVGPQNAQNLFFCTNIMEQKF